MSEEAKDNNQKNEENNCNYVLVKKEGCLNSLISCLTFFIILFTFLWNWDSFWLTDIKILKNIQNKYFSEKYNTESLKHNHFMRNKILIDEYEERLAKITLELLTIKEIDREQCEYLETSLMMLKNISRKVNNDELESLPCTNQECVDIKTNSFNFEKIDICK